MHKSKEFTHKQPEGFMAAACVILSLQNPTSQKFVCNAFSWVRLCACSVRAYVW